MKINYYLKNINEPSQKSIQTYFEDKKMPRISKLLQHGSAETSILNVRSEHFTKHNAFSTEIELRMGKQRLIGTEKSHDMLKSLDLAVDHLIAQLRKLESLIHKK